VDKWLLTGERRVLGALGAGRGWCPAPVGSRKVEESDRAKWAGWTQAEEKGGFDFRSSEPSSSRTTFRCHRIA